MGALLCGSLTETLPWEPPPVKDRLRGAACLEQDWMIFSVSKEKGKATALAAWAW